MRVKVYFNLHRHLFSVVALEGPRKGRVIQHAETIALDDATFKVSEAGRQRVLREKRKNVHAFVVGTLSPIQDSYPGWVNVVTYNPYKYRTFVLRDSKTPVLSSPKVWLSKKMVYALDTEGYRVYTQSVGNQHAIHHQESF